GTARDVARGDRASGRERPAVARRTRGSDSARDAGLLRLVPQERGSVADLRADGGYGRTLPSAAFGPGGLLLGTQRPSDRPFARRRVRRSFGGRRNDEPGAEFYGVANGAADLQLRPSCRRHRRTRGIGRAGLDSV